MKHSASIILVFILIGTLFFIPGARGEETAAELEARGFVADELETVPKVIDPVLQIRLPSDSLNDSIIVGNDKNGCAKGYVCSNTIGRYLNGIYRWGAGAATTFAIVLIMIGGIQYMVGSSIGSTEAAVKRMRGAAVGLVLIFSVAAILSFINPQIATLTKLQLEVIKPVLDISIATRIGGDPVATCGSEGKKMVKATSDNLTDNGEGVCETIVPKLQAAADNVFRQTGKKVSIQSGYRDAASQAGTWISNCLGKSGCHPKTCNPFPRDNTSPVTNDSGKWELKEPHKSNYETDAEIASFLKKQALDNPKQGCPHLTGFTVDIWCLPRPGSFQDDVECHTALEESMRREGFCRLYNEGWHFEYSGNASSASAKKCDWITGRSTIGRACNPEVHTSMKISSSETRSCVFDWTACSGKANLKEGKCL
jgi:hypothetical protein